MWRLRKQTNNNVKRRTRKLARYAAIGHTNKVAEKIIHLGSRLPEAINAINQASNYGRTPLIAAIYNRSTEVIKILLTHHANPNAPSRSGETPLMAAAAMNLLSVVELLIQKGANPNTVHERTGLTALMIGAGSNYTHPKIIRTLITAGSNIDAQDRGGNTALFACIDSCNEEILEILLAKKAKIDLPNRRGFTPLMKAAQMGDTHLNNVKMLVEGGANKNIQEPLYNRNALDLAIVNQIQPRGITNPSDYITQSNFHVIEYLMSTLSQPDIKYGSAFGKQFEIFFPVMLQLESKLPETDKGLIFVFDLDNTIYSWEGPTFRPLNRRCINTSIWNILLRADALRGMGVDAIFLLTNNGGYDFINEIDNALKTETGSIGKFNGTPECNIDCLSDIEKQFVRPDTIFSSVNKTGTYFFDHILTRFADVRRYESDAIKENLHIDILCPTGYTGDRYKGMSMLKRMIDVRYMAARAGVKLQVGNQDEDLMRRTYFFDDMSAHVIPIEMAHLYRGKYADHYIEISPRFECGTRDRTNLTKIDRLLTNLEAQANARIGI
jgi:ankyrin repeat protein